MEKLINYFYDNVLGFWNETGVEVTAATIRYLLDNNYSEEQVIAILDNVTPEEEYLHPDYLPGNLWEGSLLERGQFYYTSELQLRNSLPKVINGVIVSEPYYLEMRIWFSLTDLLEKFYSKTRYRELQDPARDEGAMKYLLDKYSKIKFISSLDFVLYMIGVADGVSNIFDLQKYETYAYEYLKEVTIRAHETGLDKITWRGQEAEKKYVTQRIRRG